MISNNTKIRFGSWTLDRIHMQIFDEKGKSGQLTFKEFRLLEALALSPDIPLGRKQLLKLARGNQSSVSERAIDTQLTRIRQKIGDDNSKIIRSVRGVGYMFSPAGLK